MEIQRVKLSELKHDKKNARRHDERNVEEIKRSLQEFGQHRPFVVQRGTNKVIVGNGMLDAMLSLGMTEGDAYIVDDDEETSIRRALADNRTGELASWDMAVLKDLFQDMGPDVNVPGWDTSEIEEFFSLSSDGVKTEIIEDEAPEPQPEAISKLGDIWLLGKHRLMCGDSTRAEEVDTLMNGAKADMVFTDPPYGMKKESEGVENDNQNLSQLLDFNKMWIPLSFDALTETGSWYCWGIDQPLMDIYANIIKPMIATHKATFRNLITWDKGVAQGQNSPGQRMYSPADEKCLFVMCGVQGFNNNADNYFEGWEPVRSYLDKEMQRCGGSKNWKAALGNEMGKHYFTKSQWAFPTREAYEKLQKFGREYGAFKREYEEIKREYYSTRAYFDNTHDKMTSVWHFPPTSITERELTGGHATPKPIALCARAIKTSSQEGERVLDLFGGSGSTLIACEQTGRTCYMMELSPHYVDVIIRRWQALTGGTAIHEKTGEVFPG